MLTEIVLCFLLLLIIYYKYFIWNFNYWKKRKVNGPTPKIPYGNFPSQYNHKRNTVYDIDEIYQAYKNTDTFIGVFNGGMPQLLILNADLVHRVFVNDFKHFHDNEISDYIDRKSDYIFGYNPFSLADVDWKIKRTEITPGLTVSRIKSKFPYTMDVCHEMIEYIEKRIAMDSKNPINGHELTFRFTSEVVTNYIMNIRANSFTNKPLPTAEILNGLLHNSWLFSYRETITGLLPILSKFVKLRFVSKKAESYFMNILQQAIKLRKSQTDQESHIDFLNYVLNLQEKKHLTNKELAAHMMTIIFNGFETTALAMSHCLLLLGRDIERQEKLRKEIHENEEKLTDFDAIMDLPYLDACIHETLRFYPPLPMPTKICTEPIDYNNKNGNPISIRRGDVVILPIYSIMMDEDNYPNAENFKPERFLEENNSVKECRERGLYYAFGDGPRICIGMRFALTQIKAGLVEIMRRYKVKVHPKTRSDNKFDPNYFLASLDGGVWLQFEKLY